MNLQDKEGWTLLHLVSAHGHLNIARLLVDRGADMNAKVQDLWTPLHLASHNGRLEVVQLLERGASVDEQMGGCISVALMDCNDEITELFSKHGVHGEQQ